MKKIIALILILSSIATAAEDDPITLFSTSGQIYNGISKDLKDRNVGLVVNEGQELVMFAYSDYSGIVALIFGKDARLQIRKNINKYLEWHQKAMKKGVEITKEIGMIESTRCSFQWASSYHSAFTTVTFGFYSVNSKDHRFVISIAEVTASDNEYITTTPSTLYLKKKSAIGLRNALSEKAIRGKIASEMKKRRAVYSDFE